MSELRDRINFIKKNLRKDINDLGTIDEPNINSENLDTSSDVDLIQGFGFDPSWEFDDYKHVGVKASPTCPENRKIRWDYLKELRNEYELGNSESLLHAIFVCCLSGLPMPDWIRKEYSESYKRWENFEVRTLDEAFKVKKPKSTHLNKLKQRKLYQSEIFVIVRTLKMRGIAIDEQLFDDVAETYPFSGETAKKLYYEYVNSRE